MSGFLSGTCDLLQVGSSWRHLREEGLSSSDILPKEGPMFERYTEKARRAIFFARYEASQFGSPYIETEHLLLGVLREDKALTARFLRSYASVESIRKQIEGHTIMREKVSTSVDLPLSNECKRVLAYAAEEAERLAHPHIGTEHLFLGLLRESESWAAMILTERGVDAKIVREVLAKEGVQSGVRAEIGRSREAEQRWFQIVIVSEEGDSLLHPSSWRARVPAVGEVVSVERGQGESTSYQVIKVEWNVDARTEPYLSKALIYVREVREFRG